MKKYFLKIMIAFLMFNISAAASDEYVYYTSSLVAIEGSYGWSDVENDDTPAIDQREKANGIGLKVGAETDNYRLFLSIRNAYPVDYDYAYSYGAEAQYLMNFSKAANIFFGINGGVMNLKFEDSQNNTREIKSNYIGGDIGFNMHLNATFDFEVGSRISVLSDDKHLQNGVEYKYGYFTTGYASLIIKYDMD